MRHRIEHVTGEPQGLEAVVEHPVLGGDRHHPSRGDGLGGVAVDVGGNRPDALAQDLLAKVEQQRPHPEVVETQRGREDRNRGQDRQNEQTAAEAEGGEERHGRNPKAAPRGTRES